MSFYISLVGNPFTLHTMQIYIYIYGKLPGWGIQKEMSIKYLHLYDLSVKFALMFCTNMVY